MFTIKFYSGDGFRQVIKEAESFTVLRENDGTGEAEITLHQRNPGEDSRYDIKPQLDEASSVAVPQRFAKAIIENLAGRTTEIIALNPMGPAHVKMPLPNAPGVHRGHIPGEVGGMSRGG
jgi:hypothetical protein